MGREGPLFEFRRPKSIFGGFSRKRLKCSIGMPGYDCMLEFVMLMRNFPCAHIRSMMSG